VVQALIRAIHGVDELSNELKSCSRGHHVQKVAAGASEASKREICLTLPTAILLASNKVSEDSGVVRTETSILQYEYKNAKK